MRSLNYVVMSFSVALRDVFTILESVFSALLVTIFFLPARGIFSVSPRILQRFKSLEFVDLPIFKLCASCLAQCPLSISFAIVFFWCRLTILSRASPFLLKSTMSNFCYKSGIKIRIWSINSWYSPLKTFLYNFSTVDSENDTLKHTPQKNTTPAITKVDSYMAPCCN